MITVRGLDKASGAVSTETLTLCDLAGMTELPVKSASNIDEIIKLGEKNRTVASTKMNSQR